MRKSIFKEETIGIILLVLVTIFAGYMGCTKRFAQNANKVKTETKNYDKKNYSYNDDYDYNYENDNYYDDNYYYDYVSNNYNDGYYTGDYNYNYEGYKDYDYSNNNYIFNSIVYNDTTLPSISYSSRDIIYQYDNYDPWKGVSAYHQKFGDVTNYIEITYNNLDVNIPGTYSIVYKACNYPGSSYCRTVTKEVTVKSKNSSQISNSYEKGPVWSNYSSKSCTEGSTSCSINNITKPTAKDPYSNKTLSVSLIDGYVDIYTPGTYVLVYYANTEHNISGTITKYITITEKMSNSYSSSNNSGFSTDDNYTYKTSSKYISNYSSSYYDDGIYRGYLSSDNNSGQISKYISDYKWTNRVSYTYKCVNNNQYGTDGWALISTNTSDNHPTYYYNVGGFTGTLNKTSFYCVEGQGCEYDLNKDLGMCTNVGQTKIVYRTWVGIYSGYVYTNQAKTYSGYVYSYR